MTIVAFLFVLKKEKRGFYWIFCVLGKEKSGPSILSPTQNHITWRKKSL